MAVASPLTLLNRTLNETSLQVLEHTIEELLGEAVIRMGEFNANTLDLWIAKGRKRTALVYENVIQRKRRCNGERG